MGENFGGGGGYHPAGGNAGGGGAPVPPIGMDDLIDADTTTTAPVAGDNLVYSVTLGGWVPASAAQAGGDYGNNYVFAYDTTTQQAADLQAWTDVTYSNNAQINGWIHLAGSSDFVCAADGLYMVTYEYNAEKNGGGNVEVACRGLLAGAEQVMSHAGMDVTSNNTAFPVSRSFPVIASAGDILKIQFAANNIFAKITPPPTPGVPAPSPAISGTMLIRKMT